MGNLIMNCAKKPIPTVDIEITDYMGQTPMGTCNAEAKIVITNRTSETLTSPVTFSVESSFLSAVGTVGGQVVNSEGKNMILSTVPTTPSRPWEEASAYDTGTMTIPPGVSTIYVNAQQSSQGFTESGVGYSLTCGDYESTVILTYMMATLNFTFNGSNHNCTINFTSTQSYSAGDTEGGREFNN